MYAKQKINEKTDIPLQASHSCLKNNLLGSHRRGNQATAQKLSGPLSLHCPPDPCLHDRACTLSTVHPPLQLCACTFHTATRPSPRIPGPGPKAPRPHKSSTHLRRPTLNPALRDPLTPYRVSPHQHSAARSPSPPQRPIPVPRAPRAPWPGHTKLKTPRTCDAPISDHHAISGRVFCPLAQAPRPPSRAKQTQSATRAETQSTGRSCKHPFMRRCPSRARSW